MTTSSRQAVSFEMREAWGPHWSRVGGDGLYIDSDDPHVMHLGDLSWVDPDPGQWQGVEDPEWAFLGELTWWAAADAEWREGESRWWGTAYLDGRIYNPYGDPVWSYSEASGG